MAWPSLLLPFTISSVVSLYISLCASFGCVSMVNPHCYNMVKFYLIMIKYIIISIIYRRANS